MDLRGESAPGPAQRVISWFVTGRFDLSLGSTAGFSGVLMGAVDRGIHRHLPIDEAGPVSPRPQHPEDPGPHALALPAAKQLIDRLLMAHADPMHTAMEHRLEPTSESQ